MINLPPLHQRIHHHLQPHPHHLRHPRRQHHPRHQPMQHQLQKRPSRRKKPRQHPRKPIRQHHIHHQLPQQLRQRQLQRQLRIIHIPPQHPIRIPQPIKQPPHTQHMTPLLIGIRRQRRHQRIPRTTRHRTRINPHPTHQQPPRTHHRITRRIKRPLHIAQQADIRRRRQLTRQHHEQPRLIIRQRHPNHPLPNPDPDPRPTPTPTGRTKCPLLQTKPSRHGSKPPSRCDGPASTDRCHLT
ncbi:hypothetical protein C8E86_5444 [Catellatospora citrea]|nr:hypothetical protein C8E86_5444 [Catellatospora citrea]